VEADGLTGSPLGAAVVTASDTTPYQWGTLLLVPNPCLLLLHLLQVMIAPWLLLLLPFLDLGHDQ